MLELIVAMEELGDITGEDTEIDLGDIINITYDENTGEEIYKFNKDYDNWVSYIKEKMKTNKDLEEAVKGIAIQGHTLSEIFDMSATELRNSDFGEAYAAVLNSFYKAF